MRDIKHNGKVHQLGYQRVRAWTLLIFFYINDIVDNIQCNIRLFADDNSLFTVIENDDSIKLSNEDLHRTAQWANYWCSILNPNKTKSLLKTTKRNPNWPNVVFSNIIIEVETCHTYIGITLSSDGSWGNILIIYITKQLTVP